MNYETVIGIEIHCELKTKTKMFSSAPVSVNSQPNTCVNEIDLGHPGTLPSLNKEAVRLSVMACHALNCEIDPLIKFDRKNYYYSDLPKGFQITQQFHPIGRNGYIDIPTDNGIKHIRINRLHMEEDTAKQYHSGDETWIDFNRAGTPLVEIVSEADIRSAHEAMIYVEKLRNILVYLGVTDGKMEEGSLRCDINISLREVGADAFGVKTEIKNLNSISNIEKAIQAEVIRQTELLENNLPIEQATRRYDDVQKTTILMRKKEGSVDYKYFPEPNITPVLMDPVWLKSIIDNLPELPDHREKRYMDAGLNAYDAGQLIQNKALSDFFDELINETSYVKLAANWCLSDILANFSTKQLHEKAYSLKIKEMGHMINALGKQEISSKQAKDIFVELLKGHDYHVTVKALNIEQVSDQSVLIQMVEDILNENEQSIIDYHNGKDRALGFLMGQIMKKSKGQANPVITNQLLLEGLMKRKP